MDAAFPLAGLVQDLNALLEDKDFEGAEELLYSALGMAPKYEAFFHFQLGRVYSQWNKMTSAANHLTKAAELAKAGDEELFLIQVVEELKQVRARQQGQRP